MKMRKQAKTFHANKGWKILYYRFYASSTIFKVEMFATFFKRYFHKDESLQNPNFHKKISFQHYLSYDLGKVETFLVFKVRSFQTDTFVRESVLCLVQGPNPGSFLRQCCQ